MPNVIAWVRVASAALGLDAVGKQHQRQWRLVIAVLDPATPGNADANVAELLTSTSLPNLHKWKEDGQSITLTKVGELTQRHLQRHLWDWLRTRPAIRAEQLLDVGELQHALGGATEKFEQVVREALELAGIAPNVTARVHVGWWECAELLPTGPIANLVDRRAGVSLYQSLCHWLWAGGEKAMGSASVSGTLLREDGSVISRELKWPDEFPSPKHISEIGMDNAEAALKQAHRLLAAMGDFSTSSEWAIAGEALWAQGVGSGSIEQLALASGRVVVNNPVAIRRNLPRYGLAGQWQEPADGPTGLRWALYETSMDVACDTLMGQSSLELGDPEVALPPAFDRPIDYARIAVEEVVAAAATVYKKAAERTIGRLGPSPVRWAKEELQKWQQDIEELQEGSKITTALAIQAALRMASKRPALQVMAHTAKARFDVLERLIEAQNKFTKDKCLRAGEDLAKNWGRPKWQIDGVDITSEPWPTPDVFPGELVGDADARPLLHAYEIKGQVLKKVPQEDEQLAMGVRVLCDVLLGIYLERTATLSLNTIVERPIGIQETWKERQRGWTDPAPNADWLQQSRNFGDTVRNIDTSKFGSEKFRALNKVLAAAEIKELATAKAKAQKLVNAQTKKLVNAQTKELVNAKIKGLVNAKIMK